MKHRKCSYLPAGIEVAPFVGAWIETPQNRRYLYLCLVAPFVGAWIETQLHHTDEYPCQVAPFVGAWIETKPSKELDAVDT